LPDPTLATGTAVIVCPGGAWHFLATEHEGVDVAAWLAAHGLVAFMLKYRVVRTGDDLTGQVGATLGNPDRMAELMRTLVPLAQADGRQAVRLVRDRAAEWGIAPDRIGIMGFSAGAEVAVDVATMHGAESRPDFVAAIYTAPYTSRFVPAGAPPLFALCAADDEMAAPLTLRLYADWRAAGLPAELHIYAQGGHGFGMHKNGVPSDSWIERFADWLQAQGMVGAR
jgi:acetyl esterase/lipase